MTKESACLATETQLDWLALRGNVLSVSEGISQVSDAQRPDGIACFCSLADGIVKIECLYFLYLPRTRN